VVSVDLIGTAKMLRLLLYERRANRESMVALQVLVYIYCEHDGDLTAKALTRAG
jgi:hypothetical protein